MLYSVEWLRELCPTDADDSRLARLLTARGLTVDAVEPGPHGVALDVDVPANRPDCLGHLGLARELAAVLGSALARRRPRPAGRPEAPWARVEIEDAADCARYTAGLAREVRVGPSPAWVVRRLECCGLRSINNVVDASNLVMLELGQPIHFFDHDRLRGKSDRAELRIRSARGAERLTTLDGVERRLEPSDLVIADSARAIALAGVIGGADTEIHVGTRSVLIEAAHFRPQAVRGTSRRLAAQTDASYRFERGVDAAAIADAQALALHLLAELAGAACEGEIVDVFPAPPAARELTLTFAECARLLGFEPSPGETRDALQALGLEPAGGDTEHVRLRIPSWRTDLEREADLVEEVARHLGYDRIPTAAPAAAATATAPDSGVEDRTRDLLAGLGFHEAIGYSMIAAGEDDAFVAGGSAPALPLTNPIAEPLAVLRRSIVPGLLRAADLNLRRGVSEIRLFEVGRVFQARGADAPHEPSRLALVWAGVAAPRHWSAATREVDLFDLLGVVEHAMTRLAPGVSRVRRPAGAPPGFHPGASASWVDERGTVLAWGGALHPDVQAAFEHPLLAAEVDLDPLGAEHEAPAQYRGVPRFQSVARDLSLVLGGDVDFSRLHGVLAAVEPPAPVEFEAIDRYEGRPLAAGQVALTVRFLLRPTDRTLTDEEIEGYRAALLRRLEAELGVVPRG